MRYKFSFVRWGREEDHWLSADSFREAVSSFFEWVATGDFGVREVEPKVLDGSGQCHTLPPKCIEIIEAGLSQEDQGSPGFAPPDYAPSLDHTG